MSFLSENHKNDNNGEFWDFNEFTLYMIFKIFDKNNHCRNGHFQEISERHKKSEFIKIREFTLVIIFVIFFQKWQFLLKSSFWNFLVFSVI